MTLEGPLKCLPAPEPLCEELRRCLEPEWYPDRAIRHPWVNDYYLGGQPDRTNELNALHNQKYRAKCESLPKAKATKDWYSYLFLHERPWRSDALLEIQSQLSDAEYWELVGCIWQDAEAAYHNRHLWRRIWTGRPNPQAAMPDEDRCAFAMLPHLVTIWRGTKTKAAVKGFSWTLNENTARWFAWRAHSRTRPYLARAEIEKRHILAFLSERNECEAVLLPDTVQRHALSLRFSKIPKISHEEARVLRETFGEVDVWEETKKAV
jgi:hypothetical protein